MKVFVFVSSIFYVAFHMSWAELALATFATDQNDQWAIITHNAARETAADDSDQDHPVCHGDRPVSVDVNMAAVVPYGAPVAPLAASSVIAPVRTATATKKSLNAIALPIRDDKVVYVVILSKMCVLIVILKRIFK
jgi:hypothetical protein